MNYQEVAEKIIKEFTNQNGFIQYEEDRIESALEEDHKTNRQAITDEDISLIVQYAIDDDDCHKLVEIWQETFNTLKDCF